MAASLRETDPILEGLSSFFSSPHARANMPLSEADLEQVRSLVRAGIEEAFAAMFAAARLEDFAGLMTPQVEARVREALANIQCNSENV